MHTRNTLLMAVLLVLLAGFVYFFEIRGRAEREQAERQAERLLPFEPEQVTGLTLTTPEADDVEATRSAGTWSISRPRAVAADDESLDALVDQLHRATHERLITEDAEELAAFGLQEPDARVILRLEDGSELSLAVGKDTPVGFNLYATTGDGRVYAAPRALRGAVVKSFHDLRDRSVLDFDRNAVHRVQLDTSSYTASLRRDDTGDDDAWTISEPLQARADTETIEDLLDELADTEAEAFVLDDAPGAEQLAAYGLAEPHASITLWTVDDASQRLLVGAGSEEPAGRYAMRDGGSNVFVVPADLVEALPADVDGLRNRQLLAVQRQRVRALELHETGEVRRLERDGADWKLSLPRPLQADASAASRLLGDLVDLRAEGFATGDPGATDLRIVIELGDPGLRADEDSEVEDAAQEPAAADDRERLELRVGSAAETLPGDEPGQAVAVRRVTVGGDDTVYLVSEADLEALRVDTFALRAKTLVEFTQTDLTALEIATDEDTTHRLERQGENAWQSTDGADATEAIEDLLWDLNYLRMEAVAAEWTAGEDPPLAPFGLATPRYRLVAHGADGVVVEVAIGAEAAGSGDEGRIYVRIGDGNGVYEVGASLADAVEDVVEALEAP